MMMRLHMKLASERVRIRTQDSIAEKGIKKFLQSEATETKADRIKKGR